MKAFVRILSICVAPAFLVGCQNIGYRDLPRDRYGYTQAIAESWKEQMLLNIVKVRYLDPPVYLDISSVINSTSLETEVSLTATLFPHLGENNSRGAGAIGRFGQTPTISYEPLSGQRLVKSMHTPIPPETVFATIGGGGRADFILRATVQAINGIYNVSSSPSRGRRHDPRFLEAAELIGRISEGGGMSLRIEPRESGIRSTLTLRAADDEQAADIARLKALLGLDAARDTFALGFGAARGGNDEIVVLTRTMQGVIGDLSAGVEVPPEDIAQGRATARGKLASGEADDALLRIRSGMERPADAYAAVFYRNRWFWIDDTDLDSKRSFRFLAMFSSLAETGTTPAAPLLTIPAR
ncbi:hypothetical protein [Sulfuricystis thermophila]|uniref:hypothetical protein n=1 Tax=Sulfuricystis thermophila TaxID=2496847 RepID=UPI001035E08E|nr:hypothetical protein [Sulfuricystis thermophila]